MPGTKGIVISEFKIPSIELVLFTDQGGGLRDGDSRQGFIGVPGSYQRGLEQVGRNIKIHEKLGVGTAKPIIGLLGGQGKGFLDYVYVQVQQERTVKEQEIVSPALGVTGELEAADG